MQISVLVAPGYNFVLQQIQLIQPRLQGTLPKLLLLWFLGCSQAQAARIGELYTAELLVAAQSVRVAPELVKQALQQVLVKVSGRRDSIEQAAIVEALAESSRYIQKFSYQATQQPLASEDGREVLAHRLSIDFERTLVDQLLARGGLRPLGGIRPGVLVWLLEERDTVREFLGRDEDPVFIAMKQRARERGLPMFRPLMDLEDQGALSVGDAWGFFSDSISQASSRYQADSVLVGRLYRNQEGAWISQWLLIRSSDQIDNFQGQGAALNEHLSSAVDLAADRLFANFVGPVGELDPGTLLLEIEAVASVDDYFQLTQYLNELPAVKGIKLESIDGDRLVLQLQIEGAASQLRGAIGLNNHFKQLPSLADSPQAGRLYYRWLR